MVKRGGYGRDFKHRFGIYPKETGNSEGKKRIWFQAVSVGELQAVKPLLQRLKESGNYWIAVTTTTSTAYTILQRDFQTISDFHGYFPLDFWPISARTWNQIRPDLAVLTESELWPEHMHQAKTREVPLLLINARISDRSFRRYSKFKGLTTFMRKTLTAIGAGSQIDKERLESLGLDPQKISLTGNLKLDKDVQPRLSEEEIQGFKTEMGFPPESRVILGSSTWPGEEMMLCRIFERLAKVFTDLRLLIVPRHAERKAEIVAELEGVDFSKHFRSDGKQAPDGTQIYVADTTGELPMLTQVAEVAFIGKSMPPHREAQSMVECAILGVPAIIGPGYSNFRAIVESLVQGELIQVVETEAALESALREQLMNPELSETRTRAQNWHNANKGALSKTLELIEENVR